MKHKFNLEATLLPGNLSSKQKKEIATKLSLPENDQKDLLFMSAILVSTGTNKNMATFLGSELILAKDTINLKALDLEHKEDKIIGHIYSSMYFDHSGDILDVEDMHSKLQDAYKNKEKSDDYTKMISSLDSSEIDVGIVAVIYRDRFPEIAEEVADGQWKVSMECYYSNFDVKIGNKIIKKEELGTNLIGKSNQSILNHLNLVVGGQALGTHMVSRVLRNIKFCGCGIVKNPANDRSIILEAANSVEHLLDQTNLLKDKEAATLDLTEEQVQDSLLLEDFNKPAILQTGSFGYVVAKNFKDSFEVVKDSFSTDYNDSQKTAVFLTERANAFGNKETYTILSLNSNFASTKSMQDVKNAEGVLYKTSDAGSIKEIISIGGSKEAAALATRFGPDNSSAGLCVNFKKYVFQRDKSVQQGKLVATHWCSLFNKPCTVLGANAQDKDCLRNKYARMTKIGYVNDYYTVPSAFNPSTPYSDENIEILSAVDMPSQMTEEEILQDKLDYDNMTTDDLRGITNNDLKGNKLQKDFMPDFTMDTTSLEDTDIPSAPIKPKKSLKLTNPHLDFPVHVKALSASERASLKNSDFGLQNERQFPIHTAEHVKSTMSIYSNICKKIKSFSKKKELFVNLIMAADKFGVKTLDFEKNAPFKLKAEGDGFNTDYAVPRLQILPLSSREQVLAAMSRYSFLKLEELSIEERSRISVNILRAASKFNINTESFRNRLNKDREN
jgi:hypothetical protein